MRLEHFLSVGNGRTVLGQFFFFIRWALSQLGSVRDSLLAGHFSPTCLQSLPPSGLEGGFG